MYYIGMQKVTNAQRVLEFMAQHGGYVRMKDVKRAHFSPSTVKRLTDEGMVERIKAGLYRPAALRDAADISIGFIDTAKAIPDGIISLISAIHYYELTTINPSSVYIAIPHSKKAPKIDYPPVKIFYFRKRFYEAGIESIETPYGPIKIYNREKTICDMFRYRKKLGEDLAIEALKSYVGYKYSDFHSLMQYAAICQVKTVIEPYLRALVG